MSLQYAVIDGVGCLLWGWDWEFDADTFGAEIGPSYSVWIVPGTASEQLEQNLKQAVVIH